MDPTLALLDSLISMGFDMKVSRTKAVRDGRDVQFVIVEIGKDFRGEGLTPAEALAQAVEAMTEHIQTRVNRDIAVLQALNTARAIRAAQA